MTEFSKADVKAAEALVAEIREGFANATWRARNPCLAFSPARWSRKRYQAKPPLMVSSVPWAT